MTHLSEKVCKTVEPDDSIQGDDLVHYTAQLENDWEVCEDERLERKFMFPGYTEALEFANLVGELAEREGHHPDLYISYGVVKVILDTSETDGLHENDFIMAAKIDQNNRRSN